MNQPILTPQKKDWNRFWGSYNSGSSQKISWSKKRILQLLRPYAEAGKKALDAGCGSGFFAQYFADQGMKTTAVDYSENALEKTKQTTGNRVRLCQCDLLNELLENKLQEKFGLVFTDGLFEHFSPAAQDKIMNNLIAVLDEQGLVVTVVPNRWSPWEIIRPFYMPGINERPFVLKELIDLNERNNLCVIKYGGINTLPCSFSPEGKIAECFGMLLYTVAHKNNCSA